TCRQVHLQSGPVPPYLLHSWIGLEFSPGGAPVTIPTTGGRSDPSRTDRLTQSEMTLSSDDEIVSRVVRGDKIAWTALFPQYGPIVERIARTNRSMASYRQSDYDVRTVMAQVFERLRRHDYRALRTFAAWRDRNPTKLFQDWLTIMTVNVIRNYIAAKLGTSSQSGASLKQLVNTLADALPADGRALSARPNITTREAAQRIIEFARDALAKEQLAVL